MNQVNEFNVLGGRLEICSLSPVTGFLRNGDCRMPTGDTGKHGVCAEVTKEFLDFTKSRGNDLSTPLPLHGFPGLKPGDRWCLCVARWKEAHESGVAPPVILSATHENVLENIPLANIKPFAK